jgi:hypothetical protein
LQLSWEEPIPLFFTPFFTLLFFELFYLSSERRRRGGIVERDGEAHERAHVREALRSWKEIPPSLGPLSQYVTTLHFDARGAADKATGWCSC